ncbi:hypothetical protein TPHA_0L00860 [Tetrapisispora phaffii CBS 4417]|uniref:PXA domain-containing protein n=1 Tax=Tetrapisispora phaffii (strain ATCC 24235 / CBS 4417 / NBRC 1672 / NRRL Y-8282 / UCD 70-5) TaxID=1071381 RepID=G8BZW5_TETPH|nr:hypothetical protein TPHA_0L00860 [Tetrapisispora phaffii CBS 4417]CCE65443.1 hypothetical protein TPHA_0L00860 [Tetrapisispora phaffii CBS 4417]
MSDIRYNANSTIVQRYQRFNTNKMKLRKAQRISNPTSDGQWNNANNISIGDAHSNTELIDTSNNLNAINRFSITDCIHTDFEQGIKITADENKHNCTVSHFNKVTEQNRHYDILDEPFQCKYPKDSTEYIRELCLSLYPSEVKYSILKINPGPQLHMHAIFALFFNNYVQSWYGTKIAVSNDEFMIKLFEISNKTITYVTNGMAKTNILLLDDISYIISQHFKTIKDIYKYDTLDLGAKSNYERYCLYQDDYVRDFPILLTAYIQDSLGGTSELQNSFVDALVDGILLTCVADNICEPYYILKGITKACDALLQKNQTEKKKDLSANVLEKASFYYSKYKIIRDKLRKMKLNFDLNQINKKMATNRKEKSIFEYYLPTFILFDIFHLNTKYPFIYAFIRVASHIVRSIPFLNYLLNALTFTYIYEKFSKHDIPKNSLIMLRTLLFPNDNLMGHSSPIPTGAEYEKYMEACVEKLWKVIQLHNLDMYLSINQIDVTNFVHILVFDKQSNKILAFKIVTTVLAHLEESNN